MVSVDIKHQVYIARGSVTATSFLLLPLALLGEKQSIYPSRIVSCSRIYLRRASVKKRSNFPALECGTLPFGGFGIILTDVETSKAFTFQTHKRFQEIDSTGRKTTTKRDDNTPIQ